MEDVSSSQDWLSLHRGNWTGNFNETYLVKNKTTPYFYLTRRPLRTVTEKSLPLYFTKCRNPILPCSSVEYPTTLQKKTLTQVFSYEFCKIFRNTIFIEQHLVTASVNITIFRLRLLKASNVKTITKRWHKGKKVWRLYQLSWSCSFGGCVKIEPDNKNCFEF